MKETYKLNDGREVQIDFEYLKECIYKEQAISSIKQIRSITGYGLKDSKDLYDKYRNSPNELIDNIKKIIGIPIDPYTKEEFMYLVEEAIDTMNIYHFTDMLDAVETMLSNVRKKGGLEALAKERDKFLNGI